MLSIKPRQRAGEKGVMFKLKSIEFGTTVARRLKQA